MRNFLFIVLFLVSGVSLAQTPTLQALVSKNTVAVGGNFTVSFRFNYSGEDFTAPGNLTKDFRILSGPNKSTSMSYVNGKMSSSVSYSYILSPLNPGEYKLEPAKINFENKTYASQSVKITVVNGNTQQNQGAQTQSDVNKKQKQKKQLQKNIYLELQLSKKNAYQGEQIVATYKLYNRAQLRGIEAQRLPEFDGFYTSDIKVDNSNNHTREVLNGIPYDVYVLKKTILIPQKSGELTLIPLEVDAVVQVQGSKAVNTWFGPRYQMEDVQVLLKSKPVKIKVKPLPANPPTGFNGAVGNFKFKTNLTPTTLNVNDALTYSIQISGVGNLPLVNNPVPEWPQEFEVYDPKLKSNFNNKTNQIQGSKKWEYLVIPRNNGDYEFEPLSFTFFNLNTKKYETITTEPTLVKVTGNASSGNGHGAPGVNRQDVSRLGTDIRFIHTRPPELEITNNNFFHSVWYYFWLIAPIFLTILAYVVMRKQTELQSDTVGLKKRKATKFAKQQLKQAEQTLNSNNKNEFYEVVFKALNGYMANKLNISNADLNKSHIRIELQKTNVSDSTIQLLMDTLDHCEMARFAPVTSISDSELLSQAQKIIIQLENEIK
tara:strand:- start:32185 stop:33987 length:1803 start_codon:yes stop_codon:yes gene_type:complete